MVRFIYSLLLTLLLPLVLLIFVFLSRKNPAWLKRLPERFGRIPHVIAEGGIWIHAASVGEVQASAAFVKALQHALPNTPIILTTFTPTGSEQVLRSFGEGVFHMYVPLDYGWMIQRFLTRLKPALLVLMERELWPNMLATTHKNNIPIMLANARLSEKSLQGYLKYPRIVQPMLQALDRVAAHNAVDAERYVRLGVADDKVAVVGSIKFDVNVPEGLAQQGQALRQQWGEQRLVLALASSHEDEDERLLDLYPQLLQEFPQLLLLLIPRHPERFDAVVNAAYKRQLKVVRRSQAQATNDTQVYVADTMGEMLKVLAAADLVLMGGSLIERGGHNPIEPAALGKAVVIGPHYFNFAEIVEGFVAVDALKVVSVQADELKQQLLSLLADDKQRHKMGQAALQLVADNRGAVAKLVNYSQSYIKKS